MNESMESNMGPEYVEDKDLAQEMAIVDHKHRKIADLMTTFKNPELAEELRQKGMKEIEKIEQQGKTVNNLYEQLESIVLLLEDSRLASNFTKGTEMVNQIKQGKIPWDIVDTQGIRRNPDFIDGINYSIGSTNNSYQNELAKRFEEKVGKKEAPLLNLAEDYDESDRDFPFAATLNFYDTGLYFEDKMGERENLIIIDLSLQSLGTEEDLENYISKTSELSSCSDELLKNKNIRIKIAKNIPSYILRGIRQGVIRPSEK